MDLAIDQADIEKTCTEFLNAWKAKDAKTCFDLLDRHFKDKCSVADLEKMINAQIEPGIFEESQGGQGIRRRRENPLLCKFLAR